MQTARPAVKAWQGLNNVADPLRLDLSWLAQADNVEVSSRQALQRASGYIKRASGSAITGAYATKDLQRLYLIDNGTLKQVLPDYTYRTLKTGLSAAPAYFTEVNGVVFYSNGTDYGLIANEVKPWGIPVPSAPFLTAGSGKLLGGTYQVCCTYVDAEGLESGNGEVSLITVDDGAQIGVTAPQRAGYTTNVYATMRDGTVFYLLGSGSVSYNCDPNELEMELPFWLMDGPRGTIPAFWGGSMYIAEWFPAQDYSVIWKSEPLDYHHFDYGSEGLMVPGEVRMLYGLNEALLIGTDRGIHAYNGEALATLATYGVVPGVHVSEWQGNAFFWSLRGLVRALPLVNLTQGTVSVAPGLQAAGMVVERDGARRYLVALHKGGTAYNPRVTE